MEPGKDFKTDLAADSFCVFGKQASLPQTSSAFVREHVKNQADVHVSPDQQRTRRSKVSDLRDEREEVQKKLPIPTQSKTLLHSKKIEVQPIAKPDVLCSIGIKLCSFVYYQWRANGGRRPRTSKAGGIRNEIAKIIFY